MKQLLNRSPTVFLVEDEPVLRMIVTEFLEDEGFAVLAAPDADHALDILDHHADVDVLFTDIDMPGSLDGADLALKVAERWPDLPVVLATGKSMPPLSRLPVGCEFVPKPYRLEMLAKRFHRLLER